MHRLAGPPSRSLDGHRPAGVLRCRDAVLPAAWSASGLRVPLILLAILPHFAWAISCDDDPNKPAGPVTAKLWLAAVAGAIALSLIRRAWNPPARWKLRTFKIGMSLLQIGWWATLLLFIGVSLLCTGTHWPFQTWLVLPAAIEMLFYGAERLKRRLSRNPP